MARQRQRVLAQHGTAEHIQRQAAEEPQANAAGARRGDRPVHHGQHQERRADGREPLRQRQHGQGQADDHRQQHAAEGVVHAIDHLRASVRRPRRGGRASVAAQRGQWQRVQRRRRLALQGGDCRVVVAPFFSWAGAAGCVSWNHTSMTSCSADTWPEGSR